MPRLTSPVTGAPCWADLLTSDVARSRDFYNRLVGWTADDPDPRFGGYFTFRRDGLGVAGCVGRQEGMEAPDGWTIYLAVEDARRTVELARSNGAQIAVEPMDVADLGTMAVLVDPTGAAVGIWQPGEHKGFGVAYESGAPAWFELHTRAYDRALDFYRTVFGWTTQTMSDTPDFRYSVLQHGELQLAGVMDDSPYAPEGAPSYWLLYLEVPDTDAALQRVRELGGSVRREAEDTPYGRLASIADPTGAALNLIGPNVSAAARAGVGQGTA